LCFIKKFGWFPCLSAEQPKGLAGLGTSETPKPLILMDLTPNPDRRNIGIA